MCVYVSMYVCVYACVWVYICACTRVHVRMRVHVCTCHGWGAAIREQPQMSVLTFPFLLAETESGYLAPEVLEKPCLCLPFPPGTLGLQMFVLQHLLLHRFWDGNSRLAQHGPSVLSHPSSSFVTLPYSVLPSILNYCKQWMEKTGT